MFGDRTDTEALCDGVIAGRDRQEMSKFRKSSPQVFAPTVFSRVFIELDFCVCDLFDGGVGVADSPVCIPVAQCSGGDTVCCENVPRMTLKLRS